MNLTSLTASGVDAAHTIPRTVRGAVGFYSLSIGAALPTIGP